MNSLHHDIKWAFDRCEHALRSGQTWDAISVLVAELHRCHLGVDADTWKAAVLACQSHSLHQLLREDPYTRDAYQKPRGYPGDAQTLDFVYRFRGLENGVSQIGRELHAITTGVPIADAVRMRCEQLGQIIRDTLEEAPRRTVVSVACGHMRELHGVPSELMAGANIWGFDHDPSTITTLQHIHRSANLQAHRLSIRTVLTGKADLPKADLIYVAGLYDYLEDATANALTRALALSLREGGALFIANLSPHNEERSFMDAVMDWPMVYRDLDAMKQIGTTLEGVNDQFRHQITSLFNDRVSCLTIQRGEA